MRSFLGVWPAGLLALVLVGACGTATQSARVPGNGDLVVRDFCGRFGRQRGSAVADLFADTARFDIQGISVSFAGRGDIARLADYGQAVHSHLRATDFKVSHDTVNCRIEERNDWLALLAVGHASYDGWFVVAGPRIARARLRLTPESSDELGEKMAGFLTWLAGEDPGALQRLLPGGRPAYDSRIAVELIARLRQWQARAR